MLTSVRLAGEGSVLALCSSSHRQLHSDGSTGASLICLARWRSLQRVLR